MLELTIQCFTIKEFLSSWIQLFSHGHKKLLYFVKNYFEVSTFLFLSFLKDRYNEKLTASFKGSIISPGWFSLGWLSSGWNILLVEYLLIGVLRAEILLFEFIQVDFLPVVDFLKVELFHTVWFFLVEFLLDAFLLDAFLIDEFQQFMSSFWISTGWIVFLLYFDWLIFLIWWIYIFFSVFKFYNNTSFDYFWCRLMPLFYIQAIFCAYYCFPKKERNVNNIS